MTGERVKCTELYLLLYQLELWLQNLPHVENLRKKVTFDNITGQDLTINANTQWSNKDYTVVTCTYVQYTDFCLAL